MCETGWTPDSLQRKMKAKARKAALSERANQQRRDKAEQRRQARDLLNPRQSGVQRRRNLQQRRRQQVAAPAETPAIAAPPALAEPPTLAAPPAILVSSAVAERSPAAEPTVVEQFVVDVEPARSSHALGQLGGAVQSQVPGTNERNTNRGRQDEDFQQSQDALMQQLQGSDVYAFDMALF